MSSCSNGKPGSSSDESKLKNNELTNDTSFLRDKNFLIKNLTNTSYVWGNSISKNNALYADSTLKCSYVEITSKQKLGEIGPFLAKALNLNKDGLSKLPFQVFCIAKQNKVNDLQPAIFYLNSPVYRAIILVIFDKDNLPIDSFNLCGGSPMPTFEGDSVTVEAEPGYSEINKNIIVTNRLTRRDFNPSRKKPPLIDSIVVKSVIGEKGNILSNKIFSKQYHIPYSPNMSY